jgi:uncharacterized protein with FMN-binding domain
VVKPVEDVRRARRIALWLTGTVAVVVLLFGYRTSTGRGTEAATPSGAGVPGVVAPAPANPSAGTAPSSGPAAPHPSAPKRAAITVNGSVAQTRWGPVQVQVRMSGHRIVDVRALVYPHGNGNDEAINAYALPRLRQEVLSAQSARIDAVSGATVTSDGYRKSLQAALDAAGFGG